MLSWPGQHRRGRIRSGRPVTPLRELDHVPSPGGWVAPPGVLPGWNWLPPPGISVTPAGLPRWVRLWHATPLIDRYAIAWMWRHGLCDVRPPAGH